MTAFVASLVILIASVIGVLAALLCAACVLSHGASDPNEKSAHALTGLRSLFVLAFCALAIASVLRRATPHPDVSVDTTNLSPEIRTGRSPGIKE